MLCEKVPSGTMSLMEASVSESGNLGLRKEKHGSFLYTAGTEANPSGDQLRNGGHVFRFYTFILLHIYVISMKSHLCNSDSNLCSVIIHPLVQSD